MLRINRVLVAATFCLQAALSLLWTQPALALEEIVASYAGPTVTFLPAEVARQRGFMREQNLDIKFLLTRSEVDRAALASGASIGNRATRSSCRSGIIIGI